MSSGLPVSWCGKKADHEPHEFDAMPLAAFGPALRVRHQCEGITEQYLRVGPFDDDDRLANEIAPALQRQFPGAIVTAVGHHPMNPVRPTAYLTILGISWTTADMIARHLGWEIHYALYDDAEWRNATDTELERLKAHRA